MHACTLITLIVVSVASASLIGYALKHHQAKVTDFDLGKILLGGIAGIVVLIVPWKQIGFIPTEIAGVKFERLLKEQKEEQIDDVVALRSQINALQEKLGLKEVAAPSADTDILTPSSEETGDLLLAFFDRYKGFYFNPRRIENWGAYQPGFQKLQVIPSDDLRSRLLKLASEREIQTKVSSNGNTLYGMSRNS